MFRTSQSVFDNRAALLMAGRYEALARTYRLPMVAEMGECILHIDTIEELAVHLRRHHLALIRRGVQRLQPQVIAVEIPRLARQRLWLRWYGHAQGDTLVSQAMYEVLPEEPGSPVIAMTYTRLAMPEFGRRGTHRRLVV